MFNFIYCMVTDFFQRVWKSATDFPLLATAFTIGTIGTQLCGETFWAVLFLSYASVFFDTLTKWIAIIKRYYRDNELRLTTWKLIINIVFDGPAWSPGYLESRKLSRIIEKLLTYTIVIMLAHAGGKWLPTLDFGFGVFKPSNVLPASVSVAVFIIEFRSISENLKEMGQAGIADMITNITNIIVSKITPKA